MAKKTVESLVIELSADVASLKKDMNKASRTVKKSTDGMAKNARNAAKSIAAIGAGFLVGATIKKIVSATKVQEQAVAQLEAGLASTGGVVGKSLDELTKKAAELQKVTTFGDEEFISAQAQLLSFTSIVGDEFDKTILLAADLSTRFGTDLKSSVIQLGKALNDPVANLSALSRSGIQFNESQKDTIKILAESGRMMEAQQIILGELETQFGGSARAARDTFGGAVEGLSNAFDDLFESTEGLDEAKDSIEDLTKALQNPETIQAINDTTSALITGGTKLVSWAAIGGSFLSGLAKKTRLAFTDLFDDENSSDVDVLTAKIERLRKVLSLPGGNAAKKEGLAKEIEELVKQRDFFKRGEDFTANDDRSPQFKPKLKPLTGLVGDDPEEVARRAKAKAAAEKAAQEIIKQQQRQADAIRKAIQSAQPAQKTYNDSEAAAKALLDSKFLSQTEYNDVLAIYKQRLDEATGANEQLYQDEEDALRIREESITQTERLNAELLRAKELFDQGDLTSEVFGRTKDRITKDLEEIKEASKEVNEIGEALAQGMQDVVSDGFVAVFKGGFDEVLASFGDLIIGMVAEAAAADILNAIGFGGKDSKGGNLSGLFGGLFSFDGGGYTGSGSRSGGLDGRGGFLSVLHPNETVVDHTKGQSMGGNTNNITFVASTDRRENDRALGQMQRQLNQTSAAGARYT